MPNTQVILQDPDNWAPLANVNVRAVNPDDGGTLDVQETGTDGYATFDTADFGDRYYFHPELTRTRIHMMVVPPFGYDLYGIDASEDYVDGREAWAVVATGAETNAHSLRTAPDGLTLFHVASVTLGNYGSLYRSRADDDGGFTTWATVTPPVVGYTCAALDFEPDGTLWAVWFDEAGDNRCFIYTSEDEGDNWTLVQTILQGGLGFTFPLWIKVDQEDPTIVSLCRVRGAGNGVRYFVTTFPGTDAGGVDVATDNNPGLFSGQMVHTQGGVVVTVLLGTGGSFRLRLYHAPDSTSPTFSQVYSKTTGADVSEWTQLLYVGVGRLIALYARASGGTGLEGMLRSDDGGLTWEEVEVPSGFIPAGGVYDDQLDVLYIFQAGASGNTFYKLEDPMAAPTTGADWESQVGPTTDFDAARTQQVTWVPKG